MIINKIYYLSLEKLTDLPIFNYTSGGKTYTKNTLPSDIALIDIWNETTGDFCIRFLKSGKLTFSNTNSATSVDIALIGGGGGGGGGYLSMNGRNGGSGEGGYSGANITQNNVKLKKNISYDIVIGQGGIGGFGGKGNGVSKAGVSGQSSKFDIYEANGGSCGGPGWPGATSENATPGSGSHPFGDSTLGTYGAGGNGGTGYGNSSGGAVGHGSNGKNGIVAIRKYNK